MKDYRVEMNGVSFEAVGPNHKFYTGTVAFRIISPLGSFTLNAPFEAAASVDEGITTALDFLKNWAASVSWAADEQHSIRLHNR